MEAGPAPAPPFRNTRPCRHHLRTIFTAIFDVVRAGRAFRLLRACVISRCSGPLAFLDPERPPREARGGADEVAALLQGDTASGLRVFQLVEVSEMAVDQDRTGQRPEVLGGLELGRVGGQEEQKLYAEVQGVGRIVDGHAYGRGPVDLPPAGQGRFLSFLRLPEKRESLAKSEKMRCLTGRRRPGRGEGNYCSWKAHCGHFGSVLTGAPRPRAAGHLHLDARGLRPAPRRASDGYTARLRCPLVSAVQATTGIQVVWPAARRPQPRLARSGCLQSLRNRRSHRQPAC
jgi:hypothetical protein